MTDAGEPHIVLTTEQRELVSALDGLGLGFAYTDGARVLFASRTYAQMVGYSVDQVMTMSDPFIMIAPRDRDRARAYTIEWMTDRPVAPSLEVALQTSTGAEKPVMLAVQKLPTDAGRVHVLVIVVDLEGTPKEIGSRADLARLARAIADAVPEPFMILRESPPGMLMANRAARALAGRLGWRASSPPSATEVLEAIGVHDAAGLLADARHGRPMPALRRRVGEAMYEITIFPTPTGCVLWWREADGAPSASAADWA